MKVRLTLSKSGAALYSGSFDVADAASFGAACADAWEKVKSDRLARETSIGAVMEHLHDDMLDLLSGAQIRLEKE